MARKRLTVEGMLVGHFATVELAEGYRLLDMAKGILFARTGAKESRSELVTPPKPLRKRRAKKAPVEPTPQS
jgi:hypothetical protein